MIGTLFIVVSNCMGMILLAKQASNIFIWSVLGQRVFLICVYIYGYKYWGLTGLGLSYIVTGVLNFVLMNIILRHFYDIRIDKRVASLLCIVVISTICTIFVRKIDILFIKYLLGLGLLLVSIVFTYQYLRKVMNLDLLTFYRNRIRK